MMRWLICLLVGVFGLANQVAAESQLLIKDQPLQITSGRLEADAGSNVVTFHDQVVARQGDVTIYAESLKIVYAGEAQELQRIEAVGDVRIVQGTRVVTGDRAEYDHQAGTIELTGNPKVHQGKDAVSGDKIMIYLNEDKTIISSQGGSRVNALFHPREEKP